MLWSLLALGCAVIVVDKQVVSEPSPSPELELKDLVSMSQSAFGERVAANPNAGVNFAWRFATPELRRRFGGYDGMHRALISPTYRPLLEHETLLFEEPTESLGRAKVVLVAINDDSGPVGYLLGFTRSRNGVWRISSLRPIGRPEPVGPSAHRVRI